MENEEPLIDSAMDRDEALAGIEIPADIEKHLMLVPLLHYGFDNKLHQGQVVIHENLAEDIVAIFSELRAMRYQIEKLIPIVVYGWDDEASMQDNNSSAFNYRPIYGTATLSNHSLGRAIDINTFINPYYMRDGTIIPVGATYNPKDPHAITASSPIVTFFKSRGWHWGGDEWDDRTDWQHFAKTDM
jgi:peptidoglycan L-alanyl-D-glutamate endopeptidase CwlK